MDIPIPYRIVTPRLTLRPWQPSDAPAICEAIRSSLDHLRAWLPWAMQEPVTPAEKAGQILKWRSRFDVGQELFYGIFDRDECKVIGGTGTHVRIGAGAREIGYWIRAGCTRQGFATEAAGALTRLGFDLQQLRFMEIHCDPQNIASAAVPRKLGYVNQVTIRNCVPNKETGPRDSAVWSMVRSEYLASPAASTAIEVFDSRGEAISLTPELASSKPT